MFAAQALQNPVNNKTQELTNFTSKIALRSIGADVRLAMKRAGL
jgi:hypothetical protein